MLRTPPYGHLAEAATKPDVCEMCAKRHIGHAWRVGTKVSQPI
jgi:hypothetical protein